MTYHESTGVPVDVIEAARRRVALIESMLTRTRMAGPFIGKTRKIAQLEAELSAQATKLEEAQRRELATA